MYKYVWLYMNTYLQINHWRNYVFKMGRGAVKTSLFPTSLGTQLWLHGKLRKISNQVDDTPLVLMSYQSNLRQIGQADTWVLLGHTNKKTYIHTPMNIQTEITTLYNFVLYRLSIQTFKQEETICITIYDLCISMVTWNVVKLWRPGSQS